MNTRNYTGNNLFIVHIYRGLKNIFKISFFFCHKNSRSSFLYIH